MHQRHDWELQTWVQSPVLAKFFRWDFSGFKYLDSFQLEISMVKSDLMDTYTIKDSSCGSKSKWALVHMCTCKAAANRSNVYVSGKNYKKTLPIPETMQGISTSGESKGERSKEKNLLTKLTGLSRASCQDLLGSQ
jgi:hypothetical protein